MVVVNEVKLRALGNADLDAVEALEVRLTGRPADDAWRSAARLALESSEAIGLVAIAGDRLVGYLVGEVRAFEFGSEPCGWILALGVEPEHARTGVGSTLLAAAEEAFRRLAVQTVRTMVRRTDVPMQTFFRRHRFVGGPFVQLELELRGPAPEVTAEDPS